MIWIIKIERKMHETVVNSFKWWWRWWVTLIRSIIENQKTHFMCVSLLHFFTSVSIICKWAKDILGLSIVQCYTFLYFVLLHHDPSAIFELYSFDIMARLSTWIHISIDEKGNKIIHNIADVCGAATEGISVYLRNGIWFIWKLYIFITETVL